VTVAPAQLSWIHRGLGTDLWLRVAGAPVGSTLLLTDGAGRELAVADVEREVQDVVLDPRILPPAPTRWQLTYAQGDDRRPVEAGSDPAGALGRIRLDLAGQPRDLRVRARNGQPVELEVAERPPWGEVDELAVEGTNLRLVGKVVGELVPTNGVLVSRGGGELAFDVEMDDRTFRTQVDLSMVPAPTATQDWDLWLVAGPERIRVGRHLDDVANKGRALVPRVVPFTRGEHAGHELVVRYTDRDNVTLTTSRIDERASDPMATWEARYDEVDDDTGDEPDRARPLDRLLAGLLRFALGLLARRRPRGDGAAPARAGTREQEARRSRPPIHLLIATVHATGGTIRATINLANALVASGEEVHLVSVYRLLDDLGYPVAPEVHRTVLADLRDDAPTGTGLRGWIRRSTSRVASHLIHPDDPRSHRFTLWTDLALVRWLRSVHDGVIVPTRAGLSIVAATYARPDTRVVPQQHVAFSSQTPELQRAVADTYRVSDAVCVLTGRDEAEVRAALGPDAATAVHRLPNLLFDLDPPPPVDLRRPRLICGGRLTPTKGTDLLLDAFARIADRADGWELRIYGSARRDRLDAVREMVRARGLTDRVLLMPPSERFELELTKGSICVVPSRSEAFGMVLIEAMRGGVPVVAFDCPAGPAEIVTDGVDGILVPPEDPEAFAAAVLALIEDEPRRAELAAAGRQSAQRYASATVAARFLEIVDEAATDLR
jgi:glycosyltransferase involved in cell wall biosynthesis